MPLSVCMGSSVPLNGCEAGVLSMFSNSCSFNCFVVVVCQHATY